jgi:sigma-B regulation protein RsbU (phosphoserine phosphatase)
VIDTENKLFYFSNAGLNRPIIKSNGKIDFLQSEGPRLPLGVQNNLSYNQTNNIIKSGDILILTTDGVNEAQNSSRELFGDERLVNALLKLNTEKLTAMEIKNTIISEVRDFTKSNKPIDDMTVLIIKVK